MVIFIITIIMEFVVSGVLVGLALAGARARFDINIRGWRGIAWAVPFIAFLDLYYIPALYLMDITVTINNSGIANLLEVEPNTELERIIGIDPTDCVLWVGKAVLARWIASR